MLVGNGEAATESASADAATPGQTTLFNATGAREPVRESFYGRLRCGGDGRGARAAAASAARGGAPSALRGAAAEARPPVAGDRRGAHGRAVRHRGRAVAHRDRASARLDEAPGVRGALPLPSVPASPAAGDARVRHGGADPAERDRLLPRAPSGRRPRPCPAPASPPQPERR